MKSLSENLLVGFLTAIGSAATAFLAIPASAVIDTRLIMSCIAVGLVAFSGAVLNGLRQKAKEPGAP